MTPQDEPRPSASGGNVAGTVVGFALLLVSLLIAVPFTGAFVMATDSCLDDCDTGPVSAAYAVAWGGMGVAVVGSLVGASWSASRRRATWGWPWAGIGLVVLTFVIGSSVAFSGSR